MSRMWHRDLRRQKKLGEENGLLFKQMFNVPELAEAILLELPMRDLLLLQRVSKHWKLIIDNSPRLQQALFFRPIAAPISYAPQANHDDAGFHREQPAIFRHPIMDENRLRNIKVNSRRFRQNLDASWRRKFLTQPPLKEVKIYQISYDHVVRASGEGVTYGDVLESFGERRHFIGSGSWEDIKWDYLATYQVVAQAKDAVYEYPWVQERSSG